MLEAALRRMLFAADPERAHRLALEALTIASRARPLCIARANWRGSDRRLPHRVMGIAFPNPVGLAAGFDKDASAGNALHALGFGWLELGTVTPLAQPGNPKPRLFRLREHRAIINRMGFNSGGVTRFAQHLARIDKRIIIGVNIGKNAATPLARAHEDYCACLEAVHARADYVAINVSSPNTHNLRKLQQGDALDALLRAICAKREQLADASGSRTPLAIKLSPELTADAVDSVARLARKHRIDGLIATNTTLSRKAVDGHQNAAQPGGLSGAPLAALSTATIARLFANLQGEIPIIGAGGIDSPQSAEDKFRAGAELVQIYTGFIYQGARLIEQIIAHLNQQLVEHKRSSLREWLDEVQVRK